MKTLGAFRLPTGGVINRDAPIGFRFNHQQMWGCSGDTLASALLANGHHLVARSLKYHRPRGIVGCGVDEGSALVTLGAHAEAIPNTRVTEIQLVKSLTATSQNCWPNLSFDLGAGLSLVSTLIPAAFTTRPLCGQPAHGRFTNASFAASPGRVWLPVNPTRIVTTNATNTAMCWWWEEVQPGSRRP